jgi:pimeloyl-ACP methyl ester carboxylesterase
MPEIRGSNATVAYEVVGSGPPVLLGHSLFCTRAMWSGVVDTLKDDYCLVNIELRGHGESTAEGPFRLTDLVDDWLAILDQEEIGRALLCGLSTGGMTAMRLALRAPERVVGLALLDTDAAAEERMARLKYSLLAWGYVRLGILPRRRLLRAMFGPESLRTRPELTSRFLSAVRGFDRRQLRHAMNAIFGRQAIDVGSIVQPTLVVVGEHDQATPVAKARAIAEAIEGAALEIIPAAGHLTAEEHPAAVAELLKPFLARCFAGRGA